MAKKEKKNARSKNSEKKIFSFVDIFKKFLMFVGSFVGILFIWSQVKAISGEPQASTVTIVYRNVAMQSSMDSNGYFSGPSMAVVWLLNQTCPLDIFMAS